MKGVEEGRAMDSILDTGFGRGKWIVALTVHTRPWNWNSVFDC